MTRIISRLSRGRLRAVVRKTVRTLVGKRPFPAALVHELTRLQVDEVECSETDVAIRLADGSCFEAHADDCPFDPRTLPVSLQARFPEACLHLAIDIVYRYVYPHAMPTIRPPHADEKLGRFHLQHRDTVDDLDVAEPERETIRRVFTLQPGDAVLDIGAYLGMGALRIAQEVGPSGNVISVEAKAENQDAYERLMQTNNVQQATLLKGGIWNSSGDMTFHCSDRQENTLVGDLARGNDLHRVRTYTIDEIVETFGLRSLALISVTVNGAEVEAIEGAARTLATLSPALTIAGWYERKGRPIHEIISPMIRQHGYEVRVGPMGRVYAWRDPA